MYHHVVGAEKVTKPTANPVTWRIHHQNHLLVDSIAAIATALLLSDCAMEGGLDPDLARNITPYFSNCLEEDMPSAGCL